MHECIGHASGQINKGVGTFNEALQNYSNTLEEARADLVALYYILDPKLVEMGVMPSLEVGKAEWADCHYSPGWAAEQQTFPMRAGLATLPRSGGSHHQFTPGNF